MEAKHPPNRPRFDFVRETDSAVTSKSHPQLCSAPARGQPTPLGLHLRPRQTALLTQPQAQLSQCEHVQPLQIAGQTHQTPFARCAGLAPQRELPEA